MHTRLFQLIALASAIFLTSCASVSVRDVNTSDATRTARPSHIYVAPFAVNPGAVKENQMRQASGRLGAEVQALLQHYTVQEVRKLGVAASPAPASRAIPRDAWIISGTITRLAEGNRLLRMAIGLGSGGTKLETQVQILAGTSKAPLLRFGTSGGSNATPGGLTNPVPFSGVPTALVNAKDGVTDDSARTARMIAGTLGNYMLQRGWVAAGNVPQVKHASRR